MNFNKKICTPKKKVFIYLKIIKREREREREGDDGGPCPSQEREREGDDGGPCPSHGHSNRS